MIRTIVIIGVSLWATGCAPAVIDAACNVWPALTYSKSQDTEETISGIEQNNAARASYCGSQSTRGVR